LVVTSVVLATTAARSGPQLTITLVVLGSAVLHATWNAIAKGIKDQLAAFTLIGLGSLPVALLVPSVPHPATASRPFIVVSALLHVGYGTTLMLSYKVGDLSHVYPLARGISPLLVAVVAAITVHERLDPLRLGGVLLVCVGLTSLVFVGGRPSLDQQPALLSAICTGLFIAAYTVVDGIGVRRSGTALGYSTWLFTLESPVIPLFAFARRGRALLAELHPVWPVGVLAGLLSLIAYALVIWAQTRGALAAIAALRETSVIVAALIGALFLHEPFGRRRVIAATLVACGIVLLNLD
jgi:drug/metabolite transporter (DMT)-like permease